MKPTPPPSQQRISQINTHWSEIIDANDPHCDQQKVAEAQKSFVRRYGGCIHQYLLGATRDPNVADELSQEVAFRFIRGDFRNADPTKGRFRDYLKTSLRNLVNDFFREEKNRAKANPLPDAQIANPESLSELDDNFAELWRAELIAHAWDALKRNEAEKDNHYFTVLKFRADYPNLNSSAMAQELSAIIGKEVTSDWVRQKLHRAREKFAKFLVREVQCTLPADDKTDVEAELADLKLLKYVNV